MPEKLLTAKEVAFLLGISEEQVKELVEKGELPAYKIGGQFLRFRKEQIEAIKEELGVAENTVGTHVLNKESDFTQTEEKIYENSLMDRMADFLYFNDFYIISFFLIILLLWIILRY